MKFLITFCFLVNQFVNTFNCPYRHIIPSFAVTEQNHIDMINCVCHRDPKKGEETFIYTTVANVRSSHKDAIMPNTNTNKVK
jgi:hypothetical protein